MGVVTLYSRTNEVFVINNISSLPKHLVYHYITKYDVNIILLTGVFSEVEIDTVVLDKLFFVNLFVYDKFIINWCKLGDLSFIYSGCKEFSNNLVLKNCFIDNIIVRII